MTAATHEAHAHEAPVERPQVEILPVKGLPIVALVIVGVVLAIQSDSMWALTWFHVAGGGLWTGVDLFFGLVLGPIIGRMSLQGRIELTARLMPKMVLIVPTLVTMTLAAGFQLARLNGYLDSSYPRHGWVVASMIVVARCRSNRVHGKQRWFLAPRACGATTWLCRARLECGYPPRLMMRATRRVPGSKMTTLSSGETK